MYSDNDDDISSIEEIGSDELLASDDLRLPEGANILIRLHALRAWLNRRQVEVGLEVGAAALDLQEAMQEASQQARPQRRSTPGNLLVQHTQEALASLQQRLSAYDEADILLEDCIAHTTASERLLVEYYLSLEELMEAADSLSPSPWREAMADVLQRVEQVGTPSEE